MSKHDPAFPFGFPPPHFGVAWQDRAARPGDYMPRTRSQAQAEVKMLLSAADLETLELRIYADRVARGGRPHRVESQIHDSVVVDTRKI